MLFDFFGTLVDYEPNRVAHLYPRTYDQVLSLGFTGSYSDFTQTWDAASSALESTAKATLREFDMTDAASAFANRAGLQLPPQTHRRLGSSYVEEWRQHLRPIPGVAELLARLATSHRLAVVSNTHDSTMVPQLLTAMGVADLFEVVVLSVDHGWCKPHPSIYNTTLARLESEATNATFVGDSFEADYRGPEGCGIRSFLIDPASNHPVPADRRLSNVLEIEARLDRHR